MKKKIIALVLAVVVLVGGIIGGTIAYLADVDSDVNVMTMGNVYIDQHEYERVVENGAWVSTGEPDKYGYTPDELQEFTQNKPLYPAVFRDGAIKWDDRNGSTAEDGTGHQQSWAQVDAPGSNQLFDDSVKNVQDKFVFVENTGKSDAYVRTWFAFEQSTMDFARWKEIIKTNADADHWSWETVASDVVIDGNEYVVMVATYLGPKSNPTGILAPKSTTYASLLQVYMVPQATNEDCAFFGETYEILALSQAVQTEGFENADSALDTAFGDATVDNVPWNSENGESVNIVDAEDVDKLQSAAATGGNITMIDDVEVNGDKTVSSGYGATGVTVKDGAVFDGNGNTLTVNDANGTWDSAVNPSNGTVKNLTIKGAFRGIFMSGATGDVYIDNVTVKDVVYTFNSDAGNKNYGVYISNSTLNGWTSFSDVHKEVVFTDCNFGEGSGYAFCRPYNACVFTNCNFDAGYTMDARAAVVFENCYLDGVLITADNVANLVTSGAANVTVK